MRMRSFRPVLLALALLACLTGAGTAGVYLLLSPTLPDVQSLRDIQLQIPMRVYSADNRLIGEFGEQRRTPIRIADTPPLFIDAILAAEDDRFYRHGGVDLAGLARATWQLVSSGQIRTGGSTITMQVAKNYYLSPEKTFARKFSEILLARQIEKELDKNDILELYVNKIYLGNRAYGIQAAAHIYYGQPIQSLDVAQLAMIAGLPKAPSAFNPLANPERALKRRNWILRRMHRLGHLDTATLDTALAAPITAAYHGATLDLDAPYIAEMARRDMFARFGRAAYSDGYKVYTTVNSRLQALAQSVVTEGLLAYDWSHGYRGAEHRLPTGTDHHPPEDLSGWRAWLENIPTLGGLVPAAITAVNDRSVNALLEDGRVIQLAWEQGLASARRFLSVNRRGAAPDRAGDVLAVGDVVRLRRENDTWHLSQIPDAQAALVSLRPGDGAIQALAGGFDFYQSKFNRATQAARQPGSNFKPFIYSAALENGFTPASIINDAPLVFDDRELEGTWRPENAGGRFLGPITLRQALTRSRNLASIRLLRALGIPTAIDYVSRFGFDPAALPRDLSLALGTHAVPPLAIANAYATFANGGYRVEAYLIQRIEDSDGHVVYTARPPTVCPEADCQPATTDESATVGNKAAPAEAANLEELLSDSKTAVPPAERIMDPRVAYLMHTLLRDVVEHGTGRRARALERNDIAGKTGTTNGPTDAWFSGYGGNRVTTVWLGFDQNQLLGRREYGGSVALPLWIHFMREALEGVPEQQRSQPDGLVTVRIDPSTGKRVRPGHPEAIFELFLAEDAPPLADPATPSASPADAVRPEEVW